MASIKKEHYFYQARKGKIGGGPGILVVDGMFKFKFNQANKAKTIYKMYCVQQANPEFACKAKATVIKREDGTFFLYSCDDIHNHLVLRSEIIAEELKQRMAEIVRKDPAAPVGTAIQTVKVEAAEEYGDDEDTFDEIVDSLGSYHALELRMLRVRDGIIGSMPRSRDIFDPKYFLKRIYGDNHKIEVLDSNKLSDEWQEIIRKNNQNSQYHWDKLTEDMRAHEDPIEEADDVIDDMGEKEDTEDSMTVQENVEVEDGPEDPPPASKNLPKRILAFTSKKLLKLFSKCERGSVDGTFKSCCKMWKQQFVWMLKLNSHWIPVVWGWLPDKSEVSYKVGFFFLNFQYGIV